MRSASTPLPAQVHTLAAPKPTIRGIVRDHLGLIFACAIRCLGSYRDDVEDVVSEALWEIHRSLPSYDPALGELQAWIYRITERRARRYVRQRRARQTVEAEALGGAGIERIADPAPTPEEHMDETHQRRLFDEACNEMAPERAQVLELHVLCGMSARAIAESLDLPEGTVKTRLRLGREDMETFVRQSERTRPRAVVAVLPLLERVSRRSLAVPDAMRVRLVERLDARIVAEPSVGGCAPRSALRPEGAAPALVVGSVLALALIGLLARPHPAVQPIPIPEARDVPVAHVPDSLPETLPPTIDLDLGDVQVATIATSRAAQPARAAAPPLRGLPQERALLHAAATAIERGDIAEACRALDHYDREFPAPALGAERDTLRQLVAR